MNQNPKQVLDQLHSGRQDTALKNYGESSQNWLLINNSNNKIFFPLISFILHASKPVSCDSLKAYEIHSLRKSYVEASALRWEKSECPKQNQNQTNLHQAHP